MIDHSGLTVIFIMHATHCERMDAYLPWKKPVTVFIVPPVKALTEDQAHYLYVLGPRGLSAFNFRSLSERCFKAIKLKLVVSCSDSFD